MSDRELIQQLQDLLCVPQQTGDADVRLVPIDMLDGLLQLEEDDHDRWQ